MSTRSGTFIFLLFECNCTFFCVRLVALKGEHYSLSKARFLFSLDFLLLPVTSTEQKVKTIFLNGTKFS